MHDRKQKCNRERRLMEKHINREIEMLVRGRSANVFVIEKSRVDLNSRLRLCACVCERERGCV